MFLKFGGSNFYCFKDEFEIDLRLNKNCPNNISQGNDYTKVICIKGANAAGKTNALKALSFICDFSHSSFNEKPESEIGVESYFDNKDPIFLFCEFRMNKIEYRYELKLTKQSVISELLLDQSKNTRIIFKRENNTLLASGEEFREIKNIPQIRGNASIISIAHQHQIKCLEPFYAFFRTTLYNVNYGGFRDLTHESLHRFYYTNPDALAFVKEKISQFDTGISDIKINKHTNSDGKEVYFPIFEFKVGSEIKALHLLEQSSGTKRLYHLLGFIYLVLNNNEQLPFSATFIADELDLHLHSKILPELTKLFEQSANAQLIFSCQNDQILDLLGKYRTVMINKDNNESYSYRLDELPSDLLRNGRAITPHYVNNSIGGVPKLG